jgi:uncharacterized protein YkwD
MNKLLPKVLKALEAAVKVSFLTFAVLVVCIAFWGAFYLGFYNGYAKGNTDARRQLNDALNARVSTQEYEQPSSTPAATQAPQQNAPNWSGPQLWEAVNARRSENGVNALSKKDELCTIASIRLNELLELGKLDAHEGFSNLPDRRDDLKWIYEKYTLTEFLVSGAVSAQEAVDLWENTLGHSKLVTGGEYVWGCTYAQNGFGVAITAF